MPAPLNFTERMRPFFDDENGLLNRAIRNRCTYYLRTKFDGFTMRDVEDAALEVRLKAWQGLDTFIRIDLSASNMEWNSALIRWCMGIARNHCLDVLKVHIRRREKLNDDSERFESGDWHDPTDGIIQDLDLKHCLENLEAEDRKAHEALYWQEILGYLQEEVALNLAIPLKEVQVDVARAKRKMKRCLGETMLE